MSKIMLYGRRGWGSTIVEAQLEWLGLDYTYEAVGDLLRRPKPDELWPRSTRSARFPHSCWRMVRS